MSARSDLVWEARSPGAGEPLRLTAVRRTVAPLESFTEIRMRFSGLCGSDLCKLDAGSWAGSIPQGWVPGHEVVGIDTRTDRWVAVNPLVSCDRCAECAIGRIHLCTSLQRIGWDLPGGMAESLHVPPQSAVPLPPDTLDPVVFVLADPMAVALHGIRCGLPGPPADGTRRLGVIGAGTLGICTAVSAVHAGWEVCLATRTADQAGRLGAILAGTGISALPATDLASGSCDAVVDAASGRSDAPLLSALKAVRDGGTVLIQNAYAPQVALSVPLREVFRRSITLRGSYSHCRAAGGDDFRDAIRLLHESAGSRWVTALTATRYPLAWLPDALATLHPNVANRPIKVLLASRR